MAAAHTPGRWEVVKSFNGYRVLRTWSSGFLQLMRTPHLRTEEEAHAAIAADEIRSRAKRAIEDNARHSHVSLRELLWAEFPDASDAAIEAAMEGAL